jgi:DNA-binding beta-propeller fold protein YncE
MLRSLAALMFAAALAAAPAADAKSGRAIAFVAVEGAGRVVAVDVSARRVIRSVRVLAPHNIAWDGVSVVVTSPGAGRVTVLDPRTLRIRRVFTGFGYPHDVEAAGRLAFVTDEARGHLLVLDVRRGRVSARIAVGSRPHDLAVVGNRLDRVVVTHRSPLLTVVDPLRRRVVARIRAGGDAHDIARDPRMSQRVYVTYWDRPGVGAIDTASGRVLWRTRFGAATHHLALDSQERRLWVSDNAGRGGSVFVASARTGRSSGVLDGCAGAHHAAVISRIRVAVACSTTGTLAIFGLRRRIASLRVGAHPHDVVVGRLG